MVLACKHVDDIVIEAPYIITEDLIKSLNIHKVVNIVTDEDTAKPEHQHVDQFSVVRQKHPDKYVEIARINDELTIEKIAQRVKENKEVFAKKFEKKSIHEAEYYKNKQTV